MKIHPFKIPKPFGENLTLQIDSGATFYDKLHQHEEIQISYIVKGEGKLIIADSVHSYKKRDFFVIGSNIPHLFQSSIIENESEMISLFFSKQSFGNHFFELQELEELHSFFEKSDIGFRLENRDGDIEKTMLTLPELSKFDRFVRFLDILNELCLAETSSLTKFVYPKKISKNDGQRLRNIYDYTAHNFQNKISLDTVAKLAFMTPNAFCRFFKQRTNKTYFEFLIELRIAHACQLLENKNIFTIAEISEASGFGSVTNFNRKFKKVKGIVPSNYIK